MSVIDGQAEPFRQTEQFQTSEGGEKTLSALQNNLRRFLAPDRVELEEIRLINGENGRSQMCEVEWKPPRYEKCEFLKEMKTAFVLSATHEAISPAIL